MKEYVIIGAGFNLNFVFDLIHDHQGKVTKVFQNIPEIRKDGVPTIRDRVACLEYEIELHDSLENFKPESQCRYVLGFMTVQKYKVVTELKEKYGITFSPLIHPTANMGSNVYMGEGVIVGPLSSIGANATLDDFCAVNRCVSIGHDVHIGKYTRIGPSAALAGTSRIGDYGNVGINATVLEYVKTGDWSVIGAGSVVTKDLPEGVVAYGVPAQVVRPNEDRHFESYRAKRAF